MLRRRKTNKGYFIVMMFFIMVILSALAASYSAFVVRQLSFARELEKDLDLQQIALSGIRYAKYSLKNDVSFRKTPHDVPCGKGTFSVSVSSKGQQFIIQSTARVDESTQTIEYTYRK